MWNPFIQTTRRIEQLEKQYSSMQSENLTSQDLRQIGIAGTYQQLGIYTEEGTRLSPQEIMSAARMAYNTFPRVSAGINNVVNIAIGAGIKFKSDDDKLNEYINTRRVEIGLKQAEPEIVEQLAWGGTSYLKHSFKDGILSRIKVIGLPQSIYADIDRVSFIKRWVQRIILKTGEEKPDGIEMVRLLRPGGGWFSIMGVPIAKKDLLQIKLGLDDWGLYGQGLLHAADDYIRILRHIMRGIAVIAKFRPVDKSIIHVGSPGPDGVWKPSPAQLYKQFRKQFQSTKDYEHYITTADAKIQRFHQDDFNMMPLTNTMIELEKSILSTTNMSFALFGEQTTYAVAYAQEQVLGLMIERIRGALECGTRPIYDRLLDEVGKLGTQYDIISIPFKSTMLRDPEERALRLWQGGLKTRNEARAINGDDPVDDSEEITDGDKFIDELRGSAQPQNGLFNLPGFGNGGGNATK